MHAPQISDACMSFKVHQLGKVRTASAAHGMGGTEQGTCKDRQEGAQDSQGTPGQGIDGLGGEKASGGRSGAVVRGRAKRLMTVGRWLKVRPTLRARLLFARDRGGALLAGYHPRGEGPDGRGGSSANLASARGSGNPPRKWVRAFKVDPDDRAAEIPHGRLIDLAFSQLGPSTAHPSDRKKGNCRKGQDAAVYFENERHYRCPSLPPEHYADDYQKGLTLDSHRYVEVDRAAHRGPAGTRRWPNRPASHNSRSRTALMSPAAPPAPCVGRANQSRNRLLQ